MANEITLTLKLAFSKDTTSDELGVDDLGIDVTGSAIIHRRMDVSTVFGTMDLGGAGAGGYCVAINHDATNNVLIRPAISDTNTIQLSPGDCCCFRLSPDATTPYIGTSAGTCEVEYMLIEA